MRFLYDPSDPYGSPAARRSAAALCLLPVLTVIAPAKAQPSKAQAIVISNPKLTSAATRFQKAITALSNSSKVTIVAEGAPVTFDETKLSGATYTASSPAAKMNLLADVADYDVKNSGGVFLLTKRYSNPEDLPCVTIGECRASLKDISTLLNRLAPITQGQTSQNQRFSVRQFFRSLSPDQVEAMERGPIPASQFTRDQIEKALTLLASTHLDHVITDSTRSTLLALNKLPEVMLRKESIDNSTFLIWTEEKQPDARHVLSGGVQSTLPVPGNILPDIAPTTLGKEFTRLSERGSKDSSTASVVYAAGLYYEEKPLTVTGLERLDAERAAAALAGVYDLRLRSLSSTRTVARRSLLASVTIFNVGEAVAAALPAPLTRLLRGKTNETFVPQELKSYFEGSVSPGRVRELTVKLYADAAVQRLRQGHERELDAAGSRGIPVANMNATDRRAVAVATMSRFLERAALILNDRPLISSSSGS